MSKEDVLSQSLEGHANLVVHHSKDRGRHFIAARDFEEDECVIIEEPYPSIFICSLFVYYFRSFFVPFHSFDNLQDMPCLCTCLF